MPSAGEPVSLLRFQNWFKLKRIFGDPRIIHSLFSIHRYHLTVKQALKARATLEGFDLKAAFGISMALVALYEWVGQHLSLL